MWIRICLLLSVAVTLLASALSAETRQVTGTVTYLERIALPPGAVLEVSLLDVSLQDTAAGVLSRDRIEMAGVPTTFSLAYNSDAVMAERSYSVSARITLDGKLMFISTSQNAVLTRGAWDHVDIVVDRVGAAQTHLPGTDWTVTEIAGQPIELKRPPTISFSETGGLAVFGGCNRFMGSFEAQSGGIEMSDAMAGTLMACPETVMTLERGLLDLLQTVTRAKSNGMWLTLLDQDGTVLIRARTGI